MQTQALLRDLLTSLKRADNERLLEAMAREINNHIFIRGTFTTGAGELTSEDMQIVLTRLQIVETTLALSARGHGPEDYAPKRPLKNQSQPTVTPIDQRVLDGLENDLRSSRGGEAVRVR